MADQQGRKRGQRAPLFEVKEDVGESNIRNRPSTSSQNRIGQNELEFIEEYRIMRLIKATLTNFIGLTGCYTSDEDVTLKIRYVVEMFEESRLREINFDSVPEMVAYAYTYGQVNLLMARDRIRTAMIQCEPLCNVLRKSDLNIVCVEDGPGISTVAFYYALQDHLKVKKHNINFSITDRNHRWKSIYNIMEFLLKEGGYGAGSQLFNCNNITTTFIAENFDKLQPVQKYEDCLRQADVVVIRQALEQVTCPVTHDGILDEIGAELKDNALVLLIDRDACEIESECLQLVWKHSFSPYQLMRHRLPLRFDHPNCTGATANASILIRRGTIFRHA